MEFRNCTEGELWQALRDANEKYDYDGNLCWRYDGIERKRGALCVTLQVKVTKTHGSRTSSSGRPLRSASWEAHRDFMRALFKINPDAKIKTALAYYKGSEDFEEKFPDTAYKQVGSMMCPMQFGETTYVPDDPEPPIPREARKPFNAMVRKVRNKLRLRAEVGEFDHIDVPPEQHTYGWFDQLAELVDKGLYLDFDLAAPLFAKRTPNNMSARDRFEMNVQAAREYWEQHVYQRGEA